MKQKIILATTSKYRITVFAYLGIPFVTESSNVEEYGLPRKNPKTLVSQLSSMKAEAVYAKHKKENSIIIGLDSIGYMKGKILEKPQSKAEAINRLSNISGKSHKTFTGICMINAKTGKKIQKVIETDSTFRKLSKKEILRYINENDNVFNICLGYDPGIGLSASFVETMTGSYHNLINGMPIEAIPDMLKKVGYR